MVIVIDRTVSLFGVDNVNVDRFFRCPLPLTILKQRKGILCTKCFFYRFDILVYIA